MHRVLSFQMGMSPPRGFGEPSEFVTKRMCFSFIFFISFLALLGGFLLGRFATERSMLMREKRRENELLATIASDVGTETATATDVQRSFNSFFDQTSENETLNVDGFVDLKNVKTVLSNIKSFKDVVEKRSSVVATLHGSHEPDRWIVLSLSGDGTRLGLELARILEKLRLHHNWIPQRTIVFCFFDGPRDSCGDNLSDYSKSMIVAYLAVHGKAVQKNGCFVASGSDIARYVVFQEFVNARDASSDLQRVIVDHCKSEDGFSRVLRLASDLPHASLSFKSNNATSTELPNEVEMQLYRRTLMRIIGLSILKFSDTPILHWDPKDFERNVRTVLKMINSTHLNDVKDQISSTVEELVTSYNERITDVKEPSPLAIRMRNDLLMRLDRALLCPDAQTDPASIPILLTQSQERISLFLSSMLKCYKDVVEMLQQG